MRGHVVSQTDASNQTTTWEYDGHGRLTQMTYPDGTSESYSYDAAHRRTGVVGLDGTVQSLSYDLAGRPTTRTVTPATGVSGHTTESFVFDEQDRMLSVSQDQVSTSLAYDSLSRLTSTTTVGRSLSHTLDAGGLPTQTTYPSSLAVSRSRTALGLVATLSAPSLTASYGWQGEMPVEKAVNGLTGSWTRDAAGRVASTYFGGAESLLAEELTRDARGLTLTQSFESLGGVGWTHAYDGAGRLLSTTSTVFDEQGQGTPGAVPRTTRPEAFGFDYDTVQNLLEMRETRSCSEETVSLPEDTSGRHRPESIGPVQLTWNAAGNLERKGDLKFTYDSLHRLAEVERETSPNVFEAVASYTYDAFMCRFS